LEYKLHIFPYLWTLVKNPTLPDLDSQYFPPFTNVQSTHSNKHIAMLLTRTTMIPTKYGFDKYDSMKYLFSTWKNGKIQEESTKILCLLFKQGTIPYALQYQVLLSLEQLQFTNMTLLPIARSVMPQFPHTGGWTIAGKGHDNKQVHICAKVLSLTVWCQVSTEGLVWL